VLFGHLVEGNVHVNILGLPNEKEQEAVTDSVLQLVVSLGGSISAEHGVGRAKRRWLALERSKADIAAMLAIKRSLDPLGILSPGRVLPNDQLHPTGR
jgi:FAD/FMN-containing dehydrogenase